MANIFNLCGIAIRSRELTEPEDDNENQCVLIRINVYYVTWYFICLITKYLINIIIFIHILYKCEKKSKFENITCLMTNKDYLLNSCRKWDSADSRKAG